jgi:hypothetical protein
MMMACTARVSSAATSRRRRTAYAFGPVIGHEGGEPDTPSRHPLGVVHGADDPPIWGFLSGSTTVILRGSPATKSGHAVRIKRGEGNMHHICGERPLLGSLLLEHGAVREDDLELALEAQAQNGERLGEILVELELLSRPALDRAVASQSGIELEQELGFGSGCGPR